jgi:hypothetical protein
MFCFACHSKERSDEEHAVRLRHTPPARAPLAIAYNDTMSETKPFRLTESVKAAG